MISCQVSEKPKIGPVAAQATTIAQHSSEGQRQPRGPRDLVGDPGEKPLEFHGNMCRRWQLRSQQRSARACSSGKQHGLIRPSGRGTPRSAGSACRERPRTAVPAASPTRPAPRSARRSPRQSAAAALCAGLPATIVKAATSRVTTALAPIDRAVADRHARHDHRAVADPDVVADRHALALPPLRGTPRRRRDSGNTRSAGS